MRLVVPAAVLQKGGGPFIGPRGGKWADAKHTIPWKEAEGGKRTRAPRELSSHVFYHSSRDVVSELRSGLFSVTDDPAASKQYLNGQPGQMHPVQLPKDLKLAKEAEIAETAKRLAPDSDYQYAWEMVEEIPGVLEALRKEGYEGIAINDLTPDNKSTHRTVTVFDPVAAGIRVGEPETVDTFDHMSLEDLEDEASLEDLEIPDEIEGDEDRVRAWVRDALSKSLRKGGPYIGPRGGKWADPKHTIPWKEPAQQSLSFGSRDLWEHDWTRSSAGERLETLASAGLDRRAVEAAARYVFDEWADYQEDEKRAQAEGPSSPAFRAALRQPAAKDEDDPHYVDGAAWNIEQKTSTDYFEALEALGFSVAPDGEATTPFQRIDEALGSPKSWEELRDRVAAFALTYGGIKPDAARTRAALTAYVREAERDGQYTFEARDPDGGADEEEREEAAAYQRWEGLLLGAGAKLPKAGPTKQVERERKAYERARAKLTAKLDRARAEEAEYERATAATDDEDAWPAPPGTSAESLEDEIHDLDASFEDEWGALERAVQRANRERGHGDGKPASKPGKGAPRAAAVPPPGEHTITPPEAFGMHPIRVEFVDRGERGYQFGPYGNLVPRESIRQWFNDLAGKVDLPPSGDPTIDAVIDGKAKVLGKGDDGIAFKVGDQVVKVSTVVPYVPENPGQRTPQQAIDMLRGQVEVGNALADLGIPALRSRFVQHGDKGFQIKPYVEIPKKFTKAQLEATRDAVFAMHDAGYAMNDQVQPGIDAEGKVVLMDTGKAAKNADERTIERDYERLALLYREHGEEVANPRAKKSPKVKEELAAAEYAGRMGKPYPKALIDTLFKRLASALREEGVENVEEEIEIERESFEIMAAPKQKKSMAHVIPGDVLEKAKYTKRWRGPDGKWQYEYPEDRAAVKLSNTVRGAHSGQIDATLTAKIDGKVAGKLDYSVVDGKPHIDLVEAHAPGKGVGSKLVEALAEYYGYANIEWGMMTESGSALRDRLDRKYGFDREAAKPKKVDVDVLAAGSVETSVEPGSSPDTQEVNVEYADKAGADAFLSRVAAIGGDAPRVQELDGRYWISADVPLSKSAPRLVIPGEVLRKAQRPPGSGWAPIPGGKKGGFRKRDGKGGWEYWYPDGKAPKRGRKAAPEGQLALDFAARVEALDTGDERYGPARPPITAQGAKLTRISDALKRIETVGRAFAAEKPAREDMRRYVEGVLRVAERLEEVHKAARAVAPGVLPELAAFDRPLATVRDALKALGDSRFFENDGARAAHLGEVSYALEAMADVCRQEHAVIDEVTVRSDTFAEAAGFTVFLSGQEQADSEGLTEWNEIATVAACERTREKLDRAGLRDVGRGQEILVLHQPKRNHLTGAEGDVAGWYTVVGEDRGMIAMLESSTALDTESTADVLTHELGHGVYYERLGEKQIERWQAFFDETHPKERLLSQVIYGAVDRYAAARVAGASLDDAASIAANEVETAFPGELAPRLAMGRLLEGTTRNPAPIEKIALKASLPFARMKLEETAKKLKIKRGDYEIVDYKTGSGYPEALLFVRHGAVDRDKLARASKRTVGTEWFRPVEDGATFGGFYGSEKRTVPFAGGYVSVTNIHENAQHLGNRLYPEETKRLVLDVEKRQAETARERKVQRAVSGAHVSSYADHNASEYWAETFAHYVVMGPKAIPPRVRATFEAIMADVGFRLRKGLYVPGEVLEKGARPSGGGWHPIPGGKHGGMRRKQGNRYVYWYPEGKGGPKKRKARKPSAPSGQIGLDFGTQPEPRAEPTPAAPQEAAQKPSKEAEREYGVEAPTKPPGVPESPAPQLDVPDIHETIAHPPEVLWIRDTREREPAEGPNGGEYLKPVPGTGELRTCDRCGRMHEVHVGVRYRDGRERVVGTGCMGTSKEYGRSIATMAVRLATKRAELERARELAAEWDSIRAKARTLDPPPFTEGPHRYPGTMGLPEGSIVVGDAREDWRPSPLGVIDDPKGTSERKTAIENAQQQWRWNRERELAGGMARWQQLEGAAALADSLPAEIAALERSLEYKVKGDEYLSAFGEQVRAEAKQAVAAAGEGALKGSPEWVEAEGAKLADFAANVWERVKTARKAERKGDPEPLRALQQEWRDAHAKAREIQETAAAAAVALRERWKAADPLGMDPGPEPDRSNGQAHYEWSDREKKFREAAFAATPSYRWIEGTDRNPEGEGYVGVYPPVSMFYSPNLPTKKTEAPTEREVAAMLRSVKHAARLLRGIEASFVRYEKSMRSPRLVLRKSQKPPGSGWQTIPGGKHGGMRRRKGNRWEHWYPDDAKQPTLGLGAVKRGASTEDKARGVLGGDFDKLRQRGFSAVPLEEALKGVKRMSDLAAPGALSLDQVRKLAGAGVAMKRREDKGGQVTMGFGAPEPKQGSLLKATTSYEELLKGVQRGGKYIKRVPYVDAKGKRRYRYFYRESAVARDVQAGEEIKLGKEHATVESVGDDGAITISTAKGKKTVPADQWGSFVSRYYGARYYDWAERRARQSINAVLRMVPRPMLEDLPGETDAERLKALEQRVPKVYAKLQAAFKRAGVQPLRAKRILATTLERRGWAPDARAAVVGSVLFHRTGPTSVRLIVDGAENLAGGGRVEAKHVAGLTELIGRTHGDTGGIGEKVAEAGHKAEEELAMISALLSKARSGKLEDQKEALTAFAKLSGIPKLDMLAQAFPGLADRAIDDARQVIREAPSVAPGPPKTHGGETALFVAGPGGKAKAMRARYRLMPAAKVIASHDPARGFAKRGNYPEGIQERAYHRDEAEQAKVIRNAQKLEPAFVANTNPDAVNGPPMVTADGVALGGNSRTMSMQTAYAQHPEKAAELREYLKANAHQFGFTEADVDAIENPILVREVEVDDTSPENMRLLVRQMNESFTQAMDPRTMQVALGRKLDETTISALSDAIEPDETLAAFLSSSRSEPFINALHRAGVIDDRNVSQYMVKGTRKLNEDGRNMVASVLVGKLIGDADLLANTRPSMVQNLARSAPAMLAATDGGKGYDLGDDLGVALSAFNDLAHRVEAGTIPALDSKMNEQQYKRLYNNFDSLFDDKHPVVDNPRARLLLEALIRRPGPQQLSAVFREYADQAKKNPEDQATMFGPAASPTDILRDALKAAVGTTYE